MARQRKNPVALTHQRLVEVLAYDRETGIFTWRKTGRAAGCVRANGYLAIKVDGEEHPAQRLAWLYMTGHWPSQEVDHRNCKKLDNRFDNLREATSSQNIWNRPLFRNNTSGAKGVYWVEEEQRWRARIAVNGKRLSLGTFDRFDDAEAAYRAASEHHFGEFARAA